MAIRYRAAYISFTKHKYSKVLKFSTVVAAAACLLLLMLKYKNKKMKNKKI